MDSFLCVLVIFPVSFLLFLDVIQWEMWCEFLVSIPDHLQPLATCVKETAVTNNCFPTVYDFTRSK